MKFKMFPEDSCTRPAEVRLEPATAMSVANGLPESVCYTKT